ncbi:MAG: hypothetical protein BWY19_00645 [bacterium ADurb.Bin212]|nr:MAG: hypothetical protein BWY19_00645 [bacterium ADurb.Bin212]
MKISNKTTVILLICLLFVIIIFAVFALNFELNNSGFSYLSKHKILQTNTEISEISENVPAPIETVKVDIPQNFELEVPFFSQAPYGLWDALHEDACEEASFLMLNAWHENKHTVLKDEADRLISEMVEYQVVQGYQNSITLQELSEIAKNKYGLRGLQVKSVASWQEIKESIYYNNSPIIAGMAGKKLNNPNFRNGGPNYHMLLIVGYDDKGFITNDPGTRKGEKYYYTNEVLFNALHDYNREDINLGEKNIMYLASDL